MQEKVKTVWAMAAVAFLPVAAVAFGALWVITLIFGDPAAATPMFQLDSGGLPLFLGIAASFLLAVPVSYVIAKMMMTRGEKRRFESDTAVRLD